MCKNVFVALLTGLVMAGMAREAAAQRWYAEGVVCGAERTEAYLPYCLGYRVALVGNHTSVVRSSSGDVVHLADTLCRLSNDSTFEFVKIFSPEHGFRGTAAAGSSVNDGTDERTGLEVVSLYGANKKPTAEQLFDVDVVLFDLQDVGCRFYTYISTLHYVMQACAEEGKTLVVLDRPNPNGHYVDGPILDSAHVSFVGMRVGTPVVYGLTIGEYARMIDSEMRRDTVVDSCYVMKVVPLEGYSHSTAVELPVAPSPNLQNSHAVALYPSLCLFEGTHVSVGRGTGFPFERAGNDGDVVMDLRKVQPRAKFDMRYVMAQYMCYDGDRKEDFFLKSLFFDRLAGNSRLRQQMLSGATIDEMRATWRAGVDEFVKYSSQFRLYE